ncbi:hypothetical protein ABBQ32_010351 [Trebouxia sp. C0010 RCD-2024]
MILLSLKDGDWYSNITFPFAHVHCSIYNFFCPRQHLLLQARGTVTSLLISVAHTDMSKRARTSDHKKELATTEREHQDDAWVESAFASRYNAKPTPKDRMPDGSMPPQVVYQLIKDMRQLDANPRLNLASFVTTWMEPEAEKLIQESANVNYVDAEQYPSSTEIQNRCVAMLADLYHAPATGVEGSVGTATLGSSEAIMLAGLAMKKKWQARMESQGKSTTKPNLIMGYNVQVG